MGDGYGYLKLLFFIRRGTMRRSSFLRDLHLLIDAFEDNDAIDLWEIPVDDLLDEFYKFCENYALAKKGGKE